MSDPIFDTLDRIDNKLDNLSVQYKKVKQQRDNLLEACKEALAWIMSNAPKSFWPSDIQEKIAIANQLKAAIADAEVDE